MHLLGQSAHVMMALDDFSSNVQTFDAVGIDGALGKPTGIGNLLRLGIEHLNKVASDDLTLLFRIGHTSQVGKELGTRIHTNNIQSQHLVVFHDLLELVLAQHSMIYEDTSESIANGLVQQYCCDTGVHATRKAEYHAVIAQLLLQFSHRSIDK